MVTALLLSHPPFCHQWLSFTGGPPAYPKALRLCVTAALTLADLTPPAVRAAAADQHAPRLRNRDGEGGGGGALVRD